jgi:outer membrane protein assembly factor BamD (BamD/ComL family)
VSFSKSTNGEAPVVAAYLQSASKHRPIANRPPRPALSRCRAPALLGLLVVLVTVAAGCAEDSNFLTKLDPREMFKRVPEAPPAPVDNFVMRGSGLEQDKVAEKGSAQAKLDGGKILYQQALAEKENNSLRMSKLADAEKIFHAITRNNKTPPLLVEEALFFEGDCQYLQGHYPKAESTFIKVLREYRFNGRYHNQANQRLFDIANFWLEDTRKLMKAYEEKREGKRWMVMPASFVHFDREKPLLDMEGRAIEALEEVRLNDISGPLGEKALFYIATVKFFREDYKDADYYYSEVWKKYPNGKLAARAVKYSILCKEMVNGGSAYDGRPLKEALELIQVAGAYPELQADDNKFLIRQIENINHQQADKDYNIAEFYRRTGHPGAAYFYYELVRRRYPGTSYSEKAIKGLEEMRRRLDKDAAKSGNPPAPSPPSQAPVQGQGPILGPEPRPLPPNMMNNANHQ